MRFVSGGATAALVVGLLSSSSFANSSGNPGYSGKSSLNCTACHTPGATQPTVTLTGPTALAAGETGQYVLVIKGGPGKVAGAGIASSGASATLVPGADLKLMSGELVQSKPKAFSAGEVRFEFSVKPTAGGAMTLFAAGNSANDDKNNTLDGVSATKLEVTVTGAAAEPEPTVVEEKAGCAATGGSPLWLLSLLAGGVWTRRSRATRR